MQWLSEALAPASVGPKNSKIVPETLWDATTRPDESLSTVPFHHLSNPSGVYEAVTLLLRYGFCFIGSAPVSTEIGTKGTLEKITKMSNIGPWTQGAWEMTSEHIDKFSDTAYTSDFLGPHTDGAYMLHSPGYVPCNLSLRY